MAADIIASRRRTMFSFLRPSPTRSVLEALPSELTDISEDKPWDGRGR